MPRLVREQIESLSAAIRSHEFLHRMLRQIEIAQRTVFHANERADWTHTRKSAEQMLIAELALRYHGDIDKVYFRLREMEKAGKDWTAGIGELASAIHSYFTTPLGMVLRRDLFGDDVAFLAPADAQQWMNQAPESSAATSAAKKRAGGRAAAASATQPKRDSTVRGEVHRTTSKSEKKNAATTRARAKKSGKKSRKR